MNDTKTYSFFWPAQILATTLVITLLIQLILLIMQTYNTSSYNNNEQTKSQLQQAVKIQERLFGLENDVVRMAKTNTTAAAVVDAFSMSEHPTNKGSSDK